MPIHRGCFRWWPGVLNAGYLWAILSALWWGLYAKLGIHIPDWSDSNSNNCSCQSNMSTSPQYCFSLSDVVLYSSFCDCFKATLLVCQLVLVGMVVGLFCCQSSGAELFAIMIHTTTALLVECQRAHPVCKIPFQQKNLWGTTGKSRWTKKDCCVISALGASV